MCYINEYIISNQSVTIIYFLTNIGDFFLISESEMMTSSAALAELPADCLREIFKYVEQDNRRMYDLRSCLLVNRMWCDTAVPILHNVNIGKKQIIASRTINGKIQWELNGN